MTDSVATLQSVLDCAWLNTRNSATNLYALIDTTKQPELVEKLKLEEPEHISLFDFDEDYDLRHITPYIVKLDSDSAFKIWLLENWMGKSSGFFFYSNTDSIETLYQHFVTFTEVFDDDKKTTSFFNYYNPLTVSIWLDTMTNDSRLEFFKPLQSIVIESPIINQIKVLELDELGSLYVSEIFENNNTEKYQCYLNQIERSADLITNRSLPWILSEEERQVFPKISKYTFMLEITKKMWAYESINKLHSFKSLLEKVQEWTDNLAQKNIVKRKDVALFLILLAKYEQQWLKHANKINVILSNREENSARIKYLNIKNIVATIE